LLSPMFAFSRELVNGRVPGVPQYRVEGINFEKELQPTDFPINDDVFKAFTEFVSQHLVFSSLSPLVARNRSFVELQLRYNIVTAAYGRQMADRVFITTDDPQVERSVASMPRARDLAVGATRRQVQP